MRIFILRLLPPLVLIAAALSFTGWAACSAVDLEDGSPAPLRFKFKGGGDKLSGFSIFQDAINEVSGPHPAQVVMLDRHLLESSIYKNQVMPQGRQIQKYNYVVTHDGFIVVAVWTKQEYYKHIYGLEDDDENCAKDQEWSAAGSLPTVKPPMSAQVMINIYPEQQDIAVSPCWVMMPTGKPRGLLDGSSKHLILAQGRNYSLETIVRDLGKAEVRGAGEITVILGGGQCLYTINDKSGTYQPNDLANRRKTALVFGDSLNDIPPKYIHDRDTGYIRLERDSASEGNGQFGILICE